MKKVSLDGGIYAIMADEEVIYIGKALRSLDKRYEQHKVTYNNKHYAYGDIYNLIDEYKSKGCFVHFKPLIKISQLPIKDRESIDERELELMELALIQLYQPIGNVQGIKTTYSLLQRKEPT